eukprot:scaffold29091_cov24-Tisochrysis_lutea.AAC.2
MKHTALTDWIMTCNIIGRNMTMPTTPWPHHLAWFQRFIPAGGCHNDQGVAMSNLVKYERCCASKPPRLHANAMNLLPGEAQ